MYTWEFQNDKLSFVVIHSMLRPRRMKDKQYVYHMKTKSSVCVQKLKTGEIVS